MKENKRKNNAIIWNKHQKWNIFWLCLSIAIRASSTVWLAALLGENAGFLQGGSGLLSLGLLMGSFVLAVIPTIFGQIQLEKSEFEGTRIYIEKFVESHKKSPGLILDKVFRKNQEPLLVTDGRKAIKEMQLIITDGLYSIISFLMDAVAMSVVVSPLFAAGYAGGAIIYLGSMKCLKGRTEAHSIQSLNDGKLLSNILFSAWDNIVVGNKHNLKLWLDRFQDKFFTSRNTNVAYRSFTSASSSIVTAVASLPILGITVWLYLKTSSNIGQTALLLSLLPRQLQTIQYLSVMSNTLSQWTGANAKIQALVASVEDPYRDRLAPTYKIQWKKISFIDNQSRQLAYRSEQEFLASIKSMKNGRVTIRGENGAGKSVLLCKLNEYLIEAGRKSFFLPVQSSLAFNADIEQMSSGNRMKAEINEIATSTTEQYILLDEWDANLDAENSGIISKLLEELARHRCIVEIRHRKDKEKSMEEKDSIMTEEQVVVPEPSPSPPILVSFRHTLKQAAAQDHNNRDDHFIAMQSFSASSSLKIPLLET